LEVLRAAEWWALVRTAEGGGGIFFLCDFLGCCCWKDEEEGSFDEGLGDV
jgi:hypothetical protein